MQGPSEAIVHRVSRMASCCPVMFAGACQARASGVPPSTLLKAAREPKPASHRRSTFVGVCPRAGRYYAQNPGTRQYLGRFGTQQAAAVAVAASMGKPLQSLKRKRAACLDLDEHCSKFAILMQVYTHDGGEPVLPSDLESAIAAMKKWPLMSVCAPGLHFASLMGKVGPWKACLGDAWARALDLSATQSLPSMPSMPSSAVALPATFRQSVPAPRPSRSPSVRSLPSVGVLRSLQHVEAKDLTENDLSVMAHILQSAAFATLEHDLTVWEAHVLHKNQYYAGFKIFVRDRLGLFRRGPHWQAVPPSAWASAGCYDKLRRCHAAGAALRKSPIPRTLSEYVTIVNALMSVLSTIDPPGVAKAKTYSCAWIARVHIIVELRVRGIPRLGSDTTTLQDVQGIFPDVGTWLSTLAKKYRLTTLRDVSAHLGYQHPPELLTMYCCFFGAPEITTTPLQFFEEAAGSLRAARMAIMQQHGITAVPAVLVSETTPQSRGR